MVDAHLVPQMTSANDGLPRYDGTGMKYMSSGMSSPSTDDTVVHPDIDTPDRENTVMSNRGLHSERRSAKSCVICPRRSTTDMPFGFLPLFVGLRPDGNTYEAMAVPMSTTLTESRAAITGPHEMIDEPSGNEPRSGRSPNTTAESTMQTNGVP